MVMPLLVGLNNCQLEWKVGDDGLSPRVKLIHPKLWTQTKFHKKACKKEKIPPKFITYLLDGEKRNRYVAKLSDVVLLQVTRR
jgi:hypothetical protein